MTKPHQIVLRSSLEERRQAVIQARQSGNTHRLAELAGITTAEMAAVMLCFPCAVVDFMALTMYRVPKGLCRNALRKKKNSRRRLLGKGAGAGAGDYGEESEFAMHPAVVAAAERFMSPETDKEVVEFEKEMWERFNDNGFWRSRDDVVWG